MALGVAVRLDGMPDEMASQATTVEVIEALGQPTYYRLEYSLDTADGDFPLLTDSKLGPGAELSILVTTEDGSVCLVKGPVYGQQIRLEQGGSGSTLIVLGADSLIKMDREDKAVAWADMSDSSAVSAILSEAGLTPDVETTDASHLEAKHTLIQRETNLAFVRKLARRNGNHFWVTCDEMGLETAHFKRPVLDGEPECDLVINLPDPPSNLTSLEISWDVERPTSATATEVDLNTKEQIEGAVASSPLTALGGIPLSGIVADVRVAHVRAPVDDNGDLQSRGESALIDASFFVRATGSTTLSSLKQVLRSHTLVNLRGAGTRHSGVWFCSGVHHSIDSSEHTMQFDLVRNGWAA
jgi:hypothetical protein